VGCDCSLVRLTIGEPSRSFHGEGHVRQSWFRIGCGGSLRGKARRRLASALGSSKEDATPIPSEVPE
jgi:hypothetical protein